MASRTASQRWAASAKRTAASLVRAFTLAKQCPGRGQGVLMQRVDRVHALDEAAGEVRVPGGQRRTDRVGKVRGMVRLRPRVRDPLDFGQDRQGIGGLAHGKTEGSGGREDLGQCRGVG